MNLRWLWMDHVPAELMLRPEERRRVLELARHKRIDDPRYRGAHRRTRTFLTLTTIPLSILFAMWMFMLVTWRLHASWKAASNLAGMLMFNFLLWTLISWAIYRTNAPYIRWALCRINRPVCIGCGYILAGADDPSRPCPECGAERETNANDAAAKQ